MLVLTRRPNERIVLPGLDITFEVLSIKGKAVRLGITAPAAVKVMRGELLAGRIAPDAVVPLVP